MPKIRKVKRSKKFKANINRKRLRNKLRKLPDIGCKDIKDAWVNTKSTRQNLGDMGLAYDANEALKIPSVKQEFLQNARHDDDNDSDLENKKNVKSPPSKVHVANNLEAEAKAPRERQFRLPNQQVQFLTYLMDKYGDDYKAMTRDKKNYYQLTWRQIRSKINTFKGVPEQYAEYLLKKGEIVLEDPTPLEETRKRKAEENVKKHCAPKPKKIKPVKTGGWLEESIDDMGFGTSDKLVDMTVDGDDTTKQSEKKLQLFSDNESDEEDKKSKSKLKKFKAVKNGKKTEDKEESNAEARKVKNTINRDGKKIKAFDKLASSDSDSEEELEGDDDNETGFVDLNDVTDEELSEDDVLDDGEFVMDSEEESD